MTCAATFGEKWASIRKRMPTFAAIRRQHNDGHRRALALQPRVMLFDEPTSALDPELADEVLRVMRNLPKKA